MNHPSDSSSSGADSDPGFDFVAAPSSRKSAATRKVAGSSSLPTPTPGKKRTLKTPPRPRRSPEINIALETEQQFQHTVAERMHRKRSQLSSFVTSTVLHIVIFLVLALWAIPRSTQPLKIGLTAELDMTDVEEAIEPSPITFEMPEVAESPVEDVAEDTSDAVEEMAADDVPTIVDAIPKEEAIADAIDPAPVAPLKTLPTGGGLEGRDAESRAKLAAKYGGSAGSEAAVELGLQWIINHQLTDGSWRFLHNQSECNGRCSHEGTVSSPEAATGLALMSLLGAGYTHQAGPYQSEIQNGLDYLKGEIRYLSYGGSLSGSGSQPTYAHAIATVALAEAWAMTKDESLRKPVTEAYRYIVTAQHRKGGWKYRPQSPGDMSVTGWMVMAIKACENAGVKPDKKSHKLAKEFVDSLQFGDGVRYGYEHTGGGDIKLSEEKEGRLPSCTAIGHLLQMYLGRELEHPGLRSACQFLLDAGTSRHDAIKKKSSFDSDIYYCYYTTLVLHHARAPQWKKWNQTVRNHLVRTQQKHGHEAGSWFFPDRHGNVGGRLYTTAMAVMTLEVYYRFMPLYQSEEGTRIPTNVTD